MSRSRNPFSPFPAGGTVVTSDRRWASLASKGYELLARNGIHPPGGLKSVAIVEVDSDKPKMVIGALAYYPVSNRDNRLVMSFDLAVDERARGRGIGKLLIDGVLAIIKEHVVFTAAKHVVVDVNVVNPILVEVLRRRGFMISYPGLGEWRAIKVIR